jgi:hypothetical protein
MAWLRLDDQFLRHPKIAPLGDGELRALLATMLYVASFRASRESGIVPKIALREVPGLTRQRVDRYLALGLWESCENPHEGLACIHDWHTYNPKDATAAERAKRYRERKDPETVTEPSRERHGPKRDAHGASRAGARARTRPVPEVLTEGRDRSTPEPPPHETAEAPGHGDRDWVGDEGGRTHSENGMEPGRRGVIGPGLKQTYTPARGDQYLERVLVQVPASEREDDLRYQFLDIPDQEVHRLLDRAADLERSMTT